MSPDNAEVDPDLERRSRRNKIAVTIGFIILIIGALAMAQFLVGVVKPAEREAPAAVDAPAAEDR